MIDIGEWAEIRRLHMAEGLSVREIANRLGIARKTVDRALANEQPAKYPARSRPSIVDPYVQYMTRILTQFPRMGAPTLAQRVGYTGGHSVFRAKAADPGEVYARYFGDGPIGTDLDMAAVRGWAKGRLLL
jgi:transposase